MLWMGSELVDWNMPVSSVLEVVQQVWPAGKRLLDIGCGAGALVQSLAEAGYEAAGCDPQAEQIERASARVRNARFSVASAESLPFADGAFDGALMVHALHHVPPAAMSSALREALRCLAGGGFLVVVEPLADVHFFEVLRVLDDETTIRRQAQEALDQAVSSKMLRRHAEHVWVRRQVFANEDALLAFAVAADPSRAVQARALWSSISERFRANGARVAGGYAFDQPIRCDVFTAP